jgi:hypothetical protein
MTGSSTGSADRAGHGRGHGSGELRHAPEQLEPGGETLPIWVMLLASRQPDYRTSDRLQALLEQRAVVEMLGRPLDW